MKKKLLSLLMAGAVVAGTTMPAFAATTQTINGLDSAELKADVTVTGTVLDQNGSAPAGRLQVEVPTALSFTVDNQGRLTAGSFTINNQSQSAIDVKVGSFQETKTGSGVNAGITLNPNIDDFDKKDRSNICLVLRHNTTDVILEHGLQDEDLVKIDGGKSATVQVLGAAGTSKTDAATEGNRNTDVDTNGVDETFNLVFKITKDKTQQVGP